MMHNIAYALYYGFFKALALLPLPVLYVFSDLIRIVVYNIAGYRKRTVAENLEKCFPDKTPEERKKIERDFYRNFCDNLIETIKLLHISDREITRRMEFANLEAIEQLVDSGKSIIIYFAHTGNWEWAPSITLHMPAGKVVFGQVYRPLRNKAFDRLMLKIRSRFGSESYPKATVMRNLLLLKRQNIISVTGFMSDQKPSHGDPAVPLMFLNRPTAFISGTETLGHKLGFAAVYWDMEKTARGHYRLTAKVLSPDMAAEKPQKITMAYAQALQQTILRNPAIWLWTHKRWKIPVLINPLQ